MLCTFSVAIPLVETPDREANEELPPSLTPSTSTAVPKAALPAELPLFLRDSTLSAVRSGLTVLPPGRRALTSVMLLICICSSALDPNCRDVFSPSLSLCAVTTTVFRANVFSESLIFIPSTSLEIVMPSSLSAYPRHAKTSVSLPPSTPDMQKYPLSSLTVQSPVPLTLTPAPVIGSPFSASTMTPDTEYLFCALREKAQSRPRIMEMTVFFIFASCFARAKVIKPYLFHIPIYRYIT